MAPSQRTAEVFRRANKSPGISLRIQEESRICIGVGAVARAKSSTTPLL